MNQVKLLLLSVISLTLIFTFHTSRCFSQTYATGAIRGFVYDKDNGEPIIFTNVYLLGTTYGASTDVNGHYTISRVPPGNYTLIVTYLGFDTLKVPITLKEQQIITKKLTMASLVLLRYLQKGRRRGQRYKPQ